MASHLLESVTHPRKAAGSPGSGSHCHSYPLILFLCFSILDSFPQSLCTDCFVVSLPLSQSLEGCLPSPLLRMPRPLLMLQGFCYRIDFYHSEGVGINISLGNVNPGSEVGAGPHSSAPPLSRGRWGRGFFRSDCSSVWNVKMFQFPQLSKLEPLCVLWPRFKNLVDC